MKNNVINQLYKKYYKYGVTVEEIEHMISAGLEYGLDPEIVRENADRQLEEEYMGMTEDDVLFRPVEIFNSTAEILTQ